MAADESVIHIKDSPVAKKRGKSCVIVISDDEMSKEGDVICLKGEKPAQASVLTRFRNPSHGNDKSTRTSGGRQRVRKKNKSGNDSFYCMDVDSFEATAKEIIVCDMTQEPSSSDKTDYNLALRLQQELNPATFNQQDNETDEYEKMLQEYDEKYARMLQEQEDIIFCSLYKKPDIEIMSITKKPTPTTVSTVFNGVTSIPNPSNMICTCSNTATCTCNSNYPSTSNISINPLTIAPVSASGIQGLVANSLIKGKQSKYKRGRKGKTTAPKVTTTSLPPNTGGRTTIGNHVKSSLTILSYAHLGKDSPSVQFMTSSSAAFALSSEDLPSWWSPCILCSEESFKKKPYHLIDIPLEDNEARVVKFPLECTGYHVIKVERIQCPNLWRRYIAEVKLLIQSRGEGFQLNEQVLYHCSRADKSIICTEGLDVRLSHDGNFGRGIYFR